MKYNNLLTIVKRLNQQQAKAERANSAAGGSQGMTSAQRARLSDKSTIESWERDKILDLLHCELVNLGLCDAKEAEDYEPREIVQSAGLGHSTRMLYSPPKPDCLK